MVRDRFADDDVVDVIAPPLATGFDMRVDSMPNPWDDVADYSVSPRYLAPALQVRKDTSASGAQFAKALSFVILAATLAAGPARSDEAKKVTLGDALTLAPALRNLDGHATVIKQNGQDATVVIPWEFGSGSLRLRISIDLNITKEAERIVEDSRAAIVKEILKDKPAGSSIAAGTPELDEFQRQIKEVLAQPLPGGQDLARIKASELKLDRNEIPVTVLSALAPVLDMDVK
jgi:hypothetical protein